MPTVKKIILLSGEIHAGKSSLAQNLSSEFGFRILKTKDAIIGKYQDRFGDDNEPSREELQEFGEALDKKYEHEWVVDYFQSKINKHDLVIIDAVRTEEQIASFREAYTHYITHIHLDASADVLKKRYVSNHSSKYYSKEKCLEVYEEIKENETERNVTKLKEDADLVIDVTDSSKDDALYRAAGFLKLLSPLNRKLVDVIIGAQFGSEGKGQVAAYLAPDYDCLVRVGGPNAGHSVYREPKPDIFHLVPSGTNRAPNAKLVIGPGAVINKRTLLDEISEHNLTPDRLTIDRNVTVISESDIEKEEELDKIGSTKQGVGAATANNIIQRIQSSDDHKAYNNKDLEPYVGSAHAVLEEMYKNGKKVLLEGTQGTFLSLYHGFYPFVTSRDTTISGCLAESGISPMRVRKIILVTRTYPIRVESPDDGYSGDFDIHDGKEITWKEISEKSGVPLEELQNTEKTSTTERKRRVAKFNWVLFRKACELNSPTDIALTFTDYIDVENQYASRYDQLTNETTRFIDEIERCAGVSVSLIATKFDYRSIIDRRNWT